MVQIVIVPRVGAEHMDDDVGIIQDKPVLGVEALCTDGRDLTVLADYFVICSGGSNTQINALCDEVEKELDQLGEQPIHREGYRGGTWVLLDYGCIAIHVFNAEAREFYGLERLWRDGKPVDISGVIEEHA